MQFLARELPEDRIQCTILAFDYPGEFSLIAGILAGAGFNILSGNVFTYSRASFEKPSDGRRKKYSSRQLLLRKKRIIDEFTGTLDLKDNFSDWTEMVRDKFRTVIGLLEKGGEEAIHRAKHSVNEMVAARLEVLEIPPARVLLPVQISIDNEEGEWTGLSVSSQDTPGFLYALSTALALKGILIESVRIFTEDSRIQDVFSFTDSSGSKITDEGLLDQIRLSVLLTKQFTYFLGSAPDPYAALSRFEQMVNDVLKLPEQGQWVEFLSAPDILGGLARLLGASDFMWEDFIRLQYESLVPMLESRFDTAGFIKPPETLRPRLESIIADVEEFEEKKRLINEFKDREIFLIDLDHILNPETDLYVLAERLSYLAEQVVDVSVRVVYDELCKRHGIPRTVAGLETPMAVFGLGKLGGEALGYASDIELLFVYSDSGRTDGESPMDNSEFFNRLVLEFNQFIQAKQKGIFNIDLRLRPYGNDGTQACSLESFFRYYGKGGPAHSYERLALVRLRTVGGDREFGAQVERIRDEMVYSSSGIDLEELRELREKQFRTKTAPGRLNAKFSPGALVDLEYDVQILQVMHGMDIPELRTPRIREALTRLEENRVLKQEESGRLAEAYYFLRQVINGLRMLRGSAEDLFMPEAGSDEFMHLARRMGYSRRNEMTPAQQLHLDFETQTAEVRAFVERHFGRDSLPDPSVGSVADLVLSYSMPRDLRERILRKAGFQDPARAYINIRNLSEDDQTRDSFARLCLLAFDVLARKPDPDMALNNWERFIRRIDDVEDHYTKLLSQPRRVDLLMGVFSGSQFLSDTLIQDPVFFNVVTDPEVLHRTYTSGDLLTAFRRMSSSTGENYSLARELRRFRKREILRIGIRDICLNVGLSRVVSDLSVLGDALIESALEGSWDEAGTNLSRNLSILALGKLGGGELNYSSDIDLIGVFDAGSDVDPRVFMTVMEKTVQLLSMHTEDGYVYRVDLRLRPYGSSGAIAHSVSGLEKYYRENAAPWEIQALLKARPVAGNLDIGRKFIDSVSDLLLQEQTRETVASCINEMREKTIKKQSLRHLKGLDIKNGEGGIRDIEFLVQGLQLINSSQHPDILTGNTLQGIQLLGDKGLLGTETARELADDYMFLRRVEHLLQIYEDRQIHTVPEDEEALNPLAKRLEGSGSDGVTLKARIEERLVRVRRNYDTFLLGK